MKNMVKGAGAPAVPAHRPLTLFNTLITVPRNTAGSPSPLMKLVPSFVAEKRQSNIPPMLSLK